MLRAGGSALAYALKYAHKIRFFTKSDGKLMDSRFAVGSMYHEAVGPRELLLSIKARSA
jgi:hypothetical protein